MFLSDTFTCPILGSLVPFFGISGDVSSGFQSQSGFLHHLHYASNGNVHSLRSTSGTAHCQPLDGQLCGWQFKMTVQCRHLMVDSQVLVKSQTPAIRIGAMSLA